MCVSGALSAVMDETSLCKSRDADADDALPFPSPNANSNSEFDVDWCGAHYSTQCTDGLGPYRMDAQAQ